RSGPEAPLEISAAKARPATVWQVAHRAPEKHPAPAAGRARPDGPRARGAPDAGRDAEGARNAYVRSPLHAGLLGAGVAAGNAGKRSRALRSIATSAASNGSGGGGGNRDATPA